MPCGGTTCAKYGLFPLLVAKNDELRRQIYSLKTVVCKLMGDIVDVHIFWSMVSTPN